MKSRNGGAAAALLLAIIITTLLSVTGWVMNIVDILTITYDLPVLVVRVAGIFIPIIGSIAGWF